MAGEVFQDSKVIGVKVEVSQAIIPRDKSLGTKIFMLVPRQARSVRDFKSHLANVVLKTPTPFQLFVGEYRIPDDEDIQIFSLINEPCRLLPVPIPRSALSSTPKGRTSDKHVTFFDTCSSSTLSLEGVGGSEIDQPDGVIYCRNIHSPETEPRLATNGSPAPPTFAMADEDGDSSRERKRRRRRKHRSRKHEKETSETDEMDTSIDKGPLGEALNGSSNARLNAVTEETESDNENLETGVTAKEFKFATPVQVSSSRKRVQAEDSKDSIKRTKLLDSSAFSTPPASSQPSTSNKSRQDTPIVPRVVKNLKIFDSARKIVDECSNGQTGGSVPMNSQSNGKNQAVNTAKGISYDSLPVVTSIDGVDVGDRIAFKVMELDERYNPAISDYKEGIVCQKNETYLSINYTKNSAVVRTGKFELPDQFNGEQQNSVENEISQLNFAECLHLKVVEKASCISSSCEEF